MAIICKSVGEEFQLQNTEGFLQAVSEGESIPFAVVKSFTNSEHYTWEELESQYTIEEDIKPLTTNRAIFVQDNRVYILVFIDRDVVKLQRIGFIVSRSPDEKIRYFIKSNDKLVNKLKGSKLMLMNYFFKEPGMFLINKVKEFDKHILCIGATRINVTPLQNTSKEILINILKKAEPALDFTITDAENFNGLNCSVLTVKSKDGYEIQKSPVIYLKGYRVLSFENSALIETENNNRQKRSKKIQNPPKEQVVEVVYTAPPEEDEPMVTTLED
ncbi:MAG: hypothetical protein PHF63_00260 [Herbinix sp.]|nr:hypothetical protein [Herbinix sp.]